MRVRGARAVVAAAFPGDIAAVRQFLMRSGFSEIQEAGNGAEALRLVRDNLPDLLVAAAVMPVMDGVSLAEKILRLPLAVYPAILLTAPSGMNVRGVPAGCEVLTKPADAQLLREAVFRTRPETRRVPDEIRRRAEALLSETGVPEHCGRGYLLRAIEMAWCDSGLLRSLTGRLYPAVAEAFGTEKRHVERAMRHVIDVAWRSGEIEAQYRIFGDTVDAKRGNPTCGEMIAQIADILRWEGKA